jgi:hypothetical protein
MDQSDLHDRMNLPIPSSLIFMPHCLTKLLPEQCMSTLCGDYLKSLQPSPPTSEHWMRVRMQSAASSRVRTLICQAWPSISPYFRSHLPNRFTCARDRVSHLSLISALDSNSPTQSPVNMPTASTSAGLAPSRLYPVQQSRPSSTVFVKI